MKLFTCMAVLSTIPLLLVLTSAMMTSSPAPFADAIAASIIPPWMLGDEDTMACFYNSNNSDITYGTPPGITLKWVKTMPLDPDAATTNNVSYSIEIDSNVFFSDANNVMLVGGPTAAANWRVMADNATNAGCVSSSPAATCEIFHSNLHSCISDSSATGFASNCLPWISPVNASNGLVLVTHTPARIGRFGAYEFALRLDAANWITIAHVKIFNSFQCAVGSRRTVHPVIPAALSAFGTAAIVGIAVGFSVLMILVLILVFCFSTRRMEAVKDLSKAPRSGAMAIVFTDIQASTTLWSSIPVVMADALDQHNDIIRRALKRHDGYEVKTIGDAIMAAFSDLTEAVQFTRDVQVDLQAAAWPAAINAIYDDISSGTHHLGMEYDDNPDDLVNCGEIRAFNGLRVRLGLHYGTPRAYFDQVNGHYDYAGSDVNISARVESSAKGGQTICSAAALHQFLVERGDRAPSSSANNNADPEHDKANHSKLKYDPDELDFTEDSKQRLRFRPVGSAQLRGVKNETELFEIVPADLAAARDFPLLDQDAKEKLAQAAMAEDEEAEKQRSIASFEAKSAAGGDGVSVASGRTQHGSGGGIAGLADADIEAAIREIITSRHPLVRTNVTATPQLATDGGAQNTTDNIFGGEGKNSNHDPNVLSGTFQTQTETSSSSGFQMSLAELQEVIRERIYHHVSLIKPMRNKKDKEKFIHELAKTWRTPIIKNNLAKTLCHVLGRSILTETKRISGNNNNNNNFAGGIAVRSSSDDRDKIMSGNYPHSPTAIQLVRVSSPTKGGSGNLPDSFVRNSYGSGAKYERQNSSEIQ